MDSPIVTQLFRQLFTHRACLQRHRLSTLQLSNTQRRYASDDLFKRAPTNESNWHKRSAVFQQDKAEEFSKFPIVDSTWLKARKRRPKRVKMLMRDFIEDSLYNPSYGYFSKQAVIFSPGEPFEFVKLKSERDFHNLLGQRYTEFEDELDKESINISRQLWHTPTELFRPYYGEAIARYLVENYKLALYPYHDLLLYEMGAGNGTLMINILDYIRDVHPEVYERTRYKIIEISTSLASLQAHQLKRTAAARGHADKVEIINRSIFDWDTYVSSPCFFLALEVFDNFAHDALRYDSVTQEAYQAYALIDDQGDFFEFYTRELDELTQRFLRVRQQACADMEYRHPLREGVYQRKLRNLFQGGMHLTQPEYIPTRLLQFFDVLYNYFPGHRLVTSDFSSLPDAVEGVNAPVVQTRYKRKTVPVTTPLVHQGYFDHLFPTDFQVTEGVYRAVTGKLTKVVAHEDFMKSWALIEETATKNGENPLLSWYKNASVLFTV
ncbi:DUF185-domain-containing protein [Pseudovirgaria hyperparasitica]|uniref:Protein arginine methyltransferase NDUFAF7 n=1 Tax=Pseudovirgaria hyperparasitica TaxID=470096 RepID=A0A6A6W222_9PEZI|nr:DUF185-domain-containing protein [Pseudovirgaria hyperparasitica]KAF2756605.1 DUF185-domain-containing protein [Pseudovirgaria hyperparasitica]